MADNQRPSTSSSTTPFPDPIAPWSILGPYIKTTTPDFTFVIGIDAHEVQSHKTFLELRSPELKKVVTESTEQKRMKLDYWDPKVFQSFHQYLYTEEFETQGFNEDEIFQLMRMGSRYCPQEGEKICEKVFAGLTLQNAHRLYRKAVNSKLPALKNKTMKFIANNVHKDAERFVQTDDFLKVDEFCLREMLQSDELRCPEVKLFEAVVKWGRKKLGQPEALGRILRQALEALIPLIRFPLMSAKDITDVVYPTQILDMNEYGSVFLSIHAGHNNRPESMFSGNPRANPPDGGDHHEQGQDSEPEPEDDQKHQVQQQGANANELENSGVDIMDEDNSDLNSDSNSTNPIGSTSQSSVASPANTNVNVDSWEHFLHVIKTKCNSHSVIAIVKTDQEDPLKTLGEKILMANLQKVVLQIDMSSEDDDENDPNGIKQLRGNFDLEPYIFFKKYDSAIHDPLWDPKSRMEFELEINGVKFFKLSRQQKIVTIGFGGDASLQLISCLAKIAKYFHKLILVDCAMPMNSGLECASFTEVMLWGIRDTTPSKLGDFLRNLPNLQHFSCWTKREKREDDVPKKSFINLATDFVSGKKLTKLAICYAKLIIPYPVNEETVKAAKKTNLMEFYTDVCHWSPHIFEHFDQMFPNLKKVSFGYCGHKFEYNEHPESSNGRPRRRKIEEKELVSYVTIRLMTNLLRIKTLEWIRVWYLNWAEEPFTKSEKDTLEAFLKETGLPFVKYAPSNFLLEKDQKNGKWKGKSYGYVLMNPRRDGKYWEEMDIFEYKLFGLDRIFRDMKAFGAYNVESDQPNE